MKNTLYQKLTSISEQYKTIHQQLEDTTIIQDVEKFKTLCKEIAQLKPIYEKFKTYQTLQNTVIENKTLMEEPDLEMQILAKEEHVMLNKQLEDTAHELQVMLLLEDPDDQRNIFLEIRAATGGAEAAIFAGDLLRMYLRYAEKQKWSTEIVSHHPSEQGGYKEVIIKIDGSAVYSKLKFESGTHRVQRVPATESQGRLHTSTCTVAILPEADTIDAVQLNMDEVEIDTFKASGAGGQHVQKTDSAVRITHKPTGKVVVCQKERSQHKNREHAMKLLQAMLLAEQRAKQQQNAAETRRNLVGTGKRSERIRTYNLPQGRLTDHRIPLTLYQLEAILGGGELNLVTHALQQYYQLEQLKEEIE